ncbi:MAG: hypothetical protein NG740_01505 [Omnitrophica bacterium]|nr:hypothetical protein [Candidatus Omnitrophota bacterium]
MKQKFDFKNFRIAGILATLFLMIYMNGCGLTATEYNNSKLGIFFKFPDEWRRQVSNRKFGPHLTLILIEKDTKNAKFAVSKLSLKQGVTNTKGDPSFSSLNPIAAGLLTQILNSNKGKFSNYILVQKGPASFAGLRGARAIESYNQGDGQRVWRMHFIPNGESSHKAIYAMTSTLISNNFLWSEDFRSIEKSWVWR